MRDLVTGGAGFIGSNLADHLLALGDEVVILDNFSTGNRENIEHLVPSPRFTVIEGDIGDPDACREACEGVDRVFHHAAFVSVPASIEHPLATAETNVIGTVNVFTAARDAGVAAVVWASSSAVYGEVATVPIDETASLNLCSPYAASKAAGELYAQVFRAAYGLPVVGLRYFNVFGKHQDPASPYAAAIPLFVSRLLAGEPVTVFGDGGQTRDFVYVDNVVSANVSAAVAASKIAGKAFNIGMGQATTVNELVSMIAAELGVACEPVHAPERSGDIRHSVADISAARDAFAYSPSVNLAEGLRRYIAWYRNHHL